MAAQPEQIQRQWKELVGDVTHNAPAHTSKLALFNVKWASNLAQSRAIDGNGGQKREMDEVAYLAAITLHLLAPVYY